MRTYKILPFLFVMISGSAFAQNNSDRIVERTEQTLDSILNFEKELLKEKIKAIDKMIDNKEISLETAEKMKFEVSQKTRTVIFDKSKMEMEKMIAELRKERDKQRNSLEKQQIEKKDSVKSINLMANKEDLAMVGVEMLELANTYGKEFEKKQKSTIDSLYKGKYASDSEFNSAMKKLDQMFEEKKEKDYVKDTVSNDVLTYDEDIIKVGGLIKINRKRGKNVSQNEINIFPTKIVSPRTYGGMFLALGFHTLSNDEHFGSDKFRVWGSKSFEIGMSRSTRIFEDTELFRINYGFSLMMNKLKMKGGDFFVDNNGITAIEPYPYAVRKSKFRTTYLTFPISLELNLGKQQYNHKNEKLSRGFRLGVGAYAGVLLGTKQKVKYYNENGEKSKEVSHNQLNTNDWIYGISAHIGYRNRAIYLKYNLVPMFRNNPVKEYPLSIGFRWGI